MNTQRECFGCRKPFIPLGDTLTILSSYVDGGEERHGTVSWCEACTRRLDRALSDNETNKADRRAKSQERHR